MEAALTEERIFLYLSLTVRLFRVACMFTVLAFCMSRSKECHTRCHCSLITTMAAIPHIEH
ncbi:hypothetical protein DAPPUDRAFT_316311 [Daphnia pulex]|uniref:Uncharacterized protein n=1 Tax=Daphnia pulex TaxID=6669 RepID=E9GCH8_DAPPU|nr:hypothetical protein DAPPUDRAFT_316311 [Daphnia pulex]|eukprot:EFX82865.1 hypothetical protein DAPPUDRAFT_316311 [Daphnia pulex]